MAGKVEFDGDQFLLYKESFSGECKVATGGSGKQSECIFTVYILKCVPEAFEFMFS